MRIGFSTGAIALGDWHKALDLLKTSSASAIELSALREDELAPLIKALSGLDLSMFDFVCFHAPSKLRTLTESKLAEMLEPVVARQWPIIVHPDIVNDYDLWSEFGELLCIENMDGRKCTGRTIEELLPVFEKLDSASFCFDIGHARHIDRTMIQAQLMIQQLHKRLKVVHLSEVDIYGHHVPLSRMAMLSISQLSDLFAQTSPIILESPISSGSIDGDIDHIKYLLSKGRGNLLQAG